MLGSLPRLRFQNSLLTPNQRYDIVVDLRVAESENNFGLGNFMVRAELLDSADTVVYSSSRAVGSYLPTLFSIN